MDAPSRLRGKILNNWVEYSGGSRPNTNKLRFSDDNYGQRLELCYIFDWDTKEVVHLTYNLDPGDFNNLLDRLLSDGYASLEKKDKNDDLFFEWKLSEGRIRFRVNIRGSAGPEGFVRYKLDDYLDLIVDELELT